jgi:hypothetical protein
MSAIMQQQAQPPEQTTRALAAMGADYGLRTSTYSRPLVFGSEPSDEEK